MKKATNTQQTKPPLKQHQDYDNVLKKTFSRVYQSIIHKLLGLDVKDMVKIPTSFSRTKEKRSDFAVKVVRPNEPPHIVHVEFQTDNDKNMDKRELGYYNDYYWEYNLEVIQYVIYLGTGTPTMPTEIKHKNLDFRYNMIVMNQIDVELFLNSDDPHEVILAVLCKYTRREAPKIIAKILEKLKQKVLNERELHEHVTDLEILSGLRNLQPQTKKEVDKMPIIYDLRKDIRFKEGLAEGLEKGLEKVNLEKRTSAIRLLKQGILSTTMIAEGLDVPLTFVLQIQKELEQKPTVKRIKKAN
jgi:predicted transposase/invertase (TIGR01784 family)